MKRLRGRSGGSSQRRRRALGRGCSGRFWWLRTLVLGATCFGTACGPAPSQAPWLAQTVDFVEQVHPAPRRYVSRAAMEDCVAEGVERLGEDPSATARARELERCIARFGDSHMAVGLTRKTVQDGLLPVLIQKVEGVVYVDAAAVELPPGTTLVAVEGTPVSELLERFAHRSMVDGDRPEVRTAQAVREFARQMLLEFGPKSEWQLAVQEPESKGSTTLRLPAIARAQLAELHAQRISAPLWGTPSSDERPWPFVETVSAESQAMVLRVPTFGIDDLSEFERRVDALFEQIPAEAALAVDLRGNEGGIRQNGIFILNHLLAEPYVQWSEVTTRVRAIPRPFRDRVSFELAPREALEEFPGTKSPGGWTFEGDPFRDLMQPESPQHRGPLTVFVDDATNSAAIEFVAALLAHRKDVRVIGAETQGECGRHVGQMPVLYEIDDELTLLLSLFAIDHVRYAGCELGRGVQPDITVAYELEQFLEGEDPYLATWRDAPSSR